MKGVENSRERRSSKSQTMFQRIQNIGEGFARKAASATELLADRELRRSGTLPYLVENASGSLHRHSRTLTNPSPL